LSKTIPAKWKPFYERAGIHGDNFIHPVPEDPEQRLYFGLLEAIAYECWKYKDAPEGITEDEVKAFLKAHRKAIRTEANPDYVSLFLGKFDFLRDDSK